MVAPGGKLPAPDALMKMLTSLVDRRVVALRGARMMKTEWRAIASYVDKTSALRFVAATDMAFLASTGAALALIPVPQVQDAIKTGKPSPVLIENAFEVMNIASALFNELDESMHVKIRKLDLMPSLPADATVALERAKTRLDLDVEITGYPKGKLSLAVL